MIINVMIVSNLELQPLNTMIKSKFDDQIFLT